MHFRSLFLGVALTASMVATIAISSGTSAQAASVKGAWSDRQVVEDVALARGPVATELGLVQEFPADVSEEIRSQGLAIESQILNEMVSKHGSAVHEAARLLTSGNPYSVEDGRKVLAETFNSSLQARFPELSANAKAESRCGLIAACAAVAVLAAALGVAVVVVAEAAVVGHAAVYAKQALWGRSSSDGASPQSGAPAFSAAEFNGLIAARLSR